MSTDHRRPARSKKTSGTPPDSEDASKKRSGSRSGGNFKPKREGGYASRPRKSYGEDRKSGGDKPYSRGTGKPGFDRKKSFDKPGGRPDSYRDQKDKPAFNKEGRSERPPFRRDDAGR